MKVTNHVPSQVSVFESIEFRRQQQVCVFTCTQESGGQLWEHFHCVNHIILSQQCLCNDVVPPLSNHKMG